MMSSPLSVAHQSEHTASIGLLDRHLGHANDKEEVQPNIVIQVRGTSESNLFAARRGYPLLRDLAHTAGSGSSSIWHGHPPPPAFIDDDDFIGTPGLPPRIGYADDDVNAGHDDELTWAAPGSYRGLVLVMPDETLTSRPRRSLQQSKTAAAANQTTPRSNPIDDALTEFSRGKDPYLIQSARDLVEAAKRYTREPEVTVDIDGALSFDLRLRDGDLLLGELCNNGTFSVTVLDDQTEKAFVKKHWSDATTRQFLEML